ncbi:hypothetical protein EYF80_016599 [Liparis tanakae]|uniref:Uncharacterized protein n=1 Tax=Liparis tanakae TaxID=230148 RepID=A0A4Z2I7G7_9TELE|nr:hypothetical protein EYF80_016599 [Liparis tanakae]
MSACSSSSSCCQEDGLTVIIFWFLFPGRTAEDNPVRCGWSGAGAEHQFFHHWVNVIKSYFFSTQLFI